MKRLPIVALVIVGLVGACTYRHETVERAAVPAATVVATPAPTGTVVYTEPAVASAMEAPGGDEAAQLLMRRTLRRARVKLPEDPIVAALAAEEDAEDENPPPTKR